MRSLLRRPRRGLILGHPDFRRLWIGNTVSQLGSQVSMLALPLTAVVTLHAGPFATGVLTALGGAAFLLVGLPAGAWVDRGRRRPVLITADLLRAGLLATVPVAAALHVLRFGQLCAVTSTVGICTVFFDVAYQSYLPPLIGRDRLVAWGAIPLGALLGGTLGTTLGVRPALWLSAAGCLAGVAWLRPVWRVTADPATPAAAVRTAP